MDERNARSRGETVETLVLLCGDLEANGKGLDLAAVSGWLRIAVPDVHVHVEHDLCDKPQGVRELVPATHSKRLVLGLCSREYPEADFEGSVRKAGLDPLGSVVVNLGGFCSSARHGRLSAELAKVMLAAAIARARAFVGSRPANTKPLLLWQDKVSRRSLWTLPPVRYRAVAFVDGTRCAANTGCDQCLIACPTQALYKDDGCIVVEKAKCEACGVCLAACPRSAIELPGASSSELVAQVTSLLDANLADLTERRLLFACKRSLMLWEDEKLKDVPTSPWLPVEVPCAGMIPAAGMLECLSSGASAVGISPCFGDCQVAQAKTIQARISFCQDLLGSLGDSRERVGFANPRGGPMSPSSIPNCKEPGCEKGEKHFLQMFGSGVAVAAVRRLASEHAAPSDLALVHPSSPLGVVELQASQCTGCAVCASACPSDALEFDRVGDSLALTFDAGLCSGCGQCQSACPEAHSGTIRVHKAVDLVRLQRRRVTLFRDDSARCVSCGSPIAPRGMLRRMALLLGPDDANLSSMIGRYCPSCRATPEAYG